MNVYEDLISSAISHIFSLPGLEHSADDARSWGSCLTLTKDHKWSLRLPASLGRTRVTPTQEPPSSPHWSNS